MFLYADILVMKKPGSESGSLLTFNAGYESGTLIIGKHAKKKQEHKTDF